MEPTAKNPDPHHIFIDEVQGHQRRWLKVIQFTSSSTKAAAIMLAAAIVALVIANSPFFEPFEEFWHTHVVVGVGGFIGEMSLAHIINDIFMAVFFLLVGLEIKYEMTVGELTNIRQAALPIIAACGGVLAPIVIYSIFNATNPETSHGWGVPTATDIAFALGIMALLGNRVPNGVRVFLSTLAVADDIIAILVIAIFYGQSPSLMWLAIAAAILVVLVLMNRAHVYALTPVHAGGLPVVVRGVHVRCSFHHRRRAARLHDPHGVARRSAEVHDLVGRPGSRGARRLCGDRAGDASEGLHVHRHPTLAVLLVRWYPRPRAWSICCTRGCTLPCCPCSR